MLTKDVVSFEQPGPGYFSISMAKCLEPSFCLLGSAVLKKFKQEGHEALHRSPEYTGQRSNII